MSRSGINRPFSWLKKVLQITEETLAPSVLSEQVRPTMDVFGWERFAPDLVGTGPQVVNANGALAADSVVLGAVPEGTMRYFKLVSCSHNDPVVDGLTLSLQLRSGGIDVGIDPPFFNTPESPIRVGLSRGVLLAPGDILLCRSLPAPAAGLRLFIRAQFVDIEFGEYIAPL